MFGDSSLFLLLPSRPTLFMVHTLHSTTSPALLTPPPLLLSSPYSSPTYTPVRPITPEYVCTEYFRVEKKWGGGRDEEKWRRRKIVGGEVVSQVRLRFTLSTYQIYQLPDQTKPGLRIQGCCIPIRDDSIATTLADRANRVLRWRKTAIQNQF